MISVIIPLYNCEDYIEACIQSVLDQSYTDFEIVVVNDGSTDGSLKIVEKMTDPRIKIVNQENKGLFHARISGMRASMSQYCMFLDADDLYQKDALRIVADKFTEGYDCVIYKVSNFYDEDVDNQMIEKGFLPNQTSFTQFSRKELLTYLFTTTKMNSIVCKAFDKSLMDLSKLSTYPRIASGEDGVFTLELFENVNSVIYLDEPLYLYRQRLSSISHSLEYRLYSDNAFRYNLYRKSARSHFQGTELSFMLRKIDSTTFRIIVSIALNNRYIPKSKETYYEVFKNIKNNKYFEVLCRRSLSKQPVYYKIIVWLVRKDMEGILWLGRSIIGVLQAIKEK